MMKRPHARRAGFTLLELLVSVSIIALIMAILLPALGRVRVTARMNKCAAQLKQINTAFASYLQDYREVIYWRGDPLDTEGVEWYIWGGRPKDNIFTGQMDIFNRFDDRPLNPYMEGPLTIFKCPDDIQPVSWALNNVHYEWVGNSYMFNCNGSPQGTGGGLAGERLLRVRTPAKTVIYLDAALGRSQSSWHGGVKGNVAFVDGHVEFLDFPEEGERYTWKP